jgi:hypothetical protein
MHALPGQAIRGSTNGQLGGMREKVVRQGRLAGSGEERFIAAGRSQLPVECSIFFAYAIGG